MILGKSNRAAREELFKRVGYKPTKEQSDAHFWDIEHPDNRIKLIAGGERAGKSNWGGMEVFSRMLEPLLRS